MRTTSTRHAAPFVAILLAAVLGGLVVWLTGPDHFGHAAEPALPSLSADAQPAVRALRSGDGAAAIPREPIALAVLSDGDLLVADVGRAEIDRFAPDGRLQTSYSGGRGLRYPVGLAVDEHDRVWVADLWQRRLFRVDLDSDRLTEVPSALSGYQSPGPLAYHDGRLYLADLERQQVLVLRGDGSLVRVLGNGPGREPAQFAYPNGIWAAPSGEVFVADTNNSRIQVFGADGRLQRVLQPPDLVYPRGLGQDTKGRLLVADSLLHAVLVLEPRSGAVLGRFPVGDERAVPLGLTVAGRHLYIADRGTSRVLVLDLGSV